MNQTPNRTPIIDVQNLSKVFKDFWKRPKVRAVSGVTFAVQPGEVFGLLGPNGSGKSTTLKMILGLLHPTTGQLRVLGQSPRDVKTKARIGYVPEESYLYPYLTAEETLDFYGTLFDLSRAERHERIEQLLDMIGLKHARRRTVGEFSKGMARRIGIAQALMNDPDLVILDEPTSGLDPIGCREVKDLIAALAQRGKTILMSSHLLADVEDICRRVAILYNGVIQAMGPIGELLEEKSRYRLTLPEVSADALQVILAKVREELGNDPAVDHPRRDLEQFFLEVVEKARQAATEQSGVGRSEGLARYLAPEKQDVLDQLSASPAATTPEPPAPPESEAERTARQRAADEKLKKLL